MIVVFFFLWGIGGAVTGGLICAVWGGFAMTFGLVHPTEDQVLGVIILMGSFATIGSAMLFAGAMIYDELRRTP